MSTISKKIGFVIPSPFNAIKAAFKAIAESTTPSPVSNPLRPSLADQAKQATPWGIGYRDLVISIGENDEDYSVVLNGCAYVGSLADLTYVINAWYSGALF